jgi:hypothetical protein
VVAYRYAERAWPVAVASTSTVSAAAAATVAVSILGFAAVATVFGRCPIVVAQGPRRRSPAWAASSWRSYLRGHVAAVLVLTGQAPSRPPVAVVSSSLRVCQAGGSQRWLRIYCEHTVSGTGHC